MPKQKKKKPSNGDRSYQEWLKENKKFEKMGLMGTDYYVNRVEDLEKKVKQLEAQLRKAKK
jgi:Tat protein secretion system quality control protein TatD with DNase activity